MYQIPKNKNVQIFTHYVLDVMDEKLTRDFSSIDNYAKHFGISQKKLQRLLSYEGTSFSQILDNYRKDKACKLLGTQGRSISKIAEELGYASSKTFNTACKRWFSKSPSQLRRDLLLKIAC